MNNGGHLIYFSSLHQRCGALLGAFFQQAPSVGVLASDMTMASTLAGRCIFLDMVGFCMMHMWRFLLGIDGGI
jgi:hypothetical protein